MSRYNYNKPVYRSNKNTPTDSFDESMYSPTKFKEAEYLSLVKEPAPEYMTHDHYVKIYSGARDTTAYPLHYDYRVSFDVPFRNIKSIQMVSCVIPDAGVSTEPVVLFDINELNYIQFSTQNGYKKVFATFPISEPNTTGHSFINLKAASPVLNFKTPLATLSSMTIKLYNVDYQPLTFGAPAGSTSKALQHSFLIKITVLESSLNPIKERPVRRDV